MIDLEKVVRGLKCCTSKYTDECPKCPYEERGLCSAMLKKDALYLLERLMPVKPIVINGVLECGECRYELRKDADSYCPCCGKKVGWPNES